jgi:hypothetical protein
VETGKEIGPDATLMAEVEDVSETLVFQLGLSTKMMLIQRAVHNFQDWCCHLVKN